MFENLQNKPEKVRRKWALGMSLAITLIILSVWLSTLSITTEGPNPLLKNNSSGHERYGSFAGIYFNIKKGITETVSLIPDLF